jgi:hypothetical protein
MATGNWKKKKKKIKEKREKRKGPSKWTRLICDTIRKNLILLDRTRLLG